MQHYGYINENGYLTSQEVYEHEENYTNAKGENKKRIVSKEEIIEKLKVNGFKPVDPIDESKMQFNVNNDYILVPKPYDNGDRISFNYIKKFDHQKIRAKIKTLKQDLSDTDFKVTKCYEASLLRQNLPYNIDKLNKERQMMRSEINHLEAIMIKKALDNDN